MARARSSAAHEKVLNAALALFSERGIEATSMDSIAAASGVSKATIYNHWADKEALLMEVMILINGASPEEMRKSYQSVEIAGRMDNPMSMPYERRNIYLVRGRKRSIVEDWLEFKHYI